MRRSNSQFIEEIIMPRKRRRFPTPPGHLKCTYYMWAPDVQALKRLLLDLALDDYQFSQALAVRSAVALFLTLPLTEQVRLIEAEDHLEQSSRV